MDVRLRHPFSALVTGPRASGKTEFVKQLLARHRDMIVPSLDRVIWCYGVRQPQLEVELKSLFENIEFHGGVPDEIKDVGYFDPQQANLVVLDDLMEHAGNDCDVANMFTRGRRHYSVIMLSQNLFHKGKFTRTISLNSDYIVAFKNTRDQTQIVHLAKQMYPGNTRFLQESYSDATSEPHSYLFLDMKPTTDDTLRVRARIFDSPSVVYRPKHVARKR